jgi:hypothetical protein
MTKPENRLFADTRPEDMREKTRGRWPLQRARKWAEETGWLCGFNFLPSTAVNFIDMWHRQTFDRETINRELGWASEIGFNSLRTNLQFVLWQEDADDYLERVEQFLQIASRHGLRTIFCLFDDCGFSGGRPDSGRQADPVPGVHNSRAMASPGREAVMDRWLRPSLEAYVKSVIGRFARDHRIAVWDIYNEPGNLMIFGRDGHKEFSDALEPHSLALLRDAFGWAREVFPQQPLTTGAWHLPMPWENQSDSIYDHRIDQEAFSLSDIISFHAYCTAEKMAEIIRKLEPLDRPLICTEWMARNIGSTINEQLPLLKRNNIGAFQWGLVRGRTQTNIPWPAVIDMMPDPDGSSSPWFHDLIDPTGQPYDAEEMKTLRALTGKPG